MVNRYYDSGWTCPHCHEELVHEDVFGKLLPGGSIDPKGDIFRCVNEECDACYFWTLDREGADELHEGYPC